MKRSPELCVILPILNEQEHIRELILRIAASLSDYSWKLLVIDDGSSDGTIEILSKLQQEYDSRLFVEQRVKTVRGCQRGSALRYGVERSLEKFDADYFIEMDGDLSHLPEEIPPGIKSLIENEADIIIVSKYLAGSTVYGRSGMRSFISRINSITMRFLLKWDITDYSNGFRLYNRKAAQEVIAHHIKFGSPIYLSEILAIWLRQGLRVIEVPGTYVGRQEGFSKVIPMDILKGWMAAFSIAFKYHFGQFEKK